MIPFLPRYRKYIMLPALALTLCMAISNCGGNNTGDSNNDDSPPLLGNDTVALAGPDRSGSIADGLLVTHPFQILYLDGGESQGDEFSWRVIDYNVEADLQQNEYEGDINGAQYKLTSINSPITGFIADTPGTYTIELTVGNGQGETDTDTVEVKLYRDMDGDGVEDADDLDRDGDGFLNENDAFPDDRVSHLDYDGDGIGNYYTDDVDGDGVKDLDDLAPLDPADAGTFSKYTEASEIPSTEASNQNDLPSQAEWAGTAPLEIDGYIYTNNAGSDVDYYQVHLPAGRFIVVMTGEVPYMDPLINMTDAPGEFEPVLTPEQAPVHAKILEIDTEGEYLFMARDASGPGASNFRYKIRIYQEKYFKDTDRDGLRDDLEKALDSNHLNYDSDGDLLPDIIEFYQKDNSGALAWDLDQDGLPNWWDLDSDNDDLVDALEFYTQDDKPFLELEALAELNDADNDGLYNFLDQDSDGNGITDTEEASLSYTEPLDFDQDDVPDYLDVDDDNDGLLDINEADGYRLTPLEAEPGVSAMRLLELYNNDLETAGVARSGDSVSLYGADLPTNPDQCWIICRFETGNPINLHPTECTEEEMKFIWPSDTPPGLIEIFVAADENYRSDSVVTLVPSEYYPVLTNIEYDPVNNTVTFEGMNLTEILTVYFTGAETTFDNLYGDGESFSMTLPEGAKTGNVYVQKKYEPEAESNALWLALTRQVQGSVQMPARSTLSVSDLDVGFSILPGEEIYPDDSGLFVTEVDISLPTTISSIIQRNGTRAEYDYAPYLSALVLPGESASVLSAGSTALAFIWNALGVSTLLAEENWEDARDQLSVLSEVQTLGDMLENKLAENPYLLDVALPSEMEDEELKEAIRAAILAGAQTLDAQVQSNHFTLARKYSGMAGIRNQTAERGTEPVIKPGEIDGIEIIQSESEANNIAVANDTQLYLSVRIESDSGQVLQPHTVAWDKVVPGQSSWLYLAKKKEFSHPGGQNCTVEVITAGIDTEYEPYEIPIHHEAGTGWYTTWNVLFTRTMIERVVINGVKCVLKFNMDPTLFSELVLKYGKSVPDVFNPIIAEGDVLGGAKALFKMFWSDLTTLPKGGPITKQILNRYFGKKWLENQLKDMAAKMCVKLAPGVGWVIWAADLYKKCNYGASAAWTIYDISTTDAVLTWDVSFPLEVTGVYPNRIRKPDGKSSRQKFLIEGNGFNPIAYKPAWWWYVTQRFKPRVIFTGADDEYQIYTDPEHISEDGKRMIVEVSGYDLDNFLRQEPLTVKIVHPSESAQEVYGLTGQKTVKKEAVWFYDRPRLDYITPSTGKENIYAKLYGSGFSNITSNNQVTVGGKDAQVISATNSRLDIQIPTLNQFETYPVKARSKYTDTWSEWSEENVTYTYSADELMPVDLFISGSIGKGQLKVFVDGNQIPPEGPVAWYATFSTLVARGRHSVELYNYGPPDEGWFWKSFRGGSGYVWVRRVSGPLGDTSIGYFYASEFCNGASMLWVIDVQPNPYNPGPYPPPYPEDNWVYQTTRRSFQYQPSVPD